MKAYQKPEVEIVKFDTMESVMGNLPGMEGGNGSFGDDTDNED